MTENHKEDIDTMYRFDEDGRLTSGPATDPAALALVEAYLPEFVASRTTG